MADNLPVTYGASSAKAAVTPNSGESPVSCGLLPLSSEFAEGQRPKWICPTGQTLAIDQDQITAISLDHAVEPKE
jgi:hypothetical protein